MCRSISPALPTCSAACLQLHEREGLERQAQVNLHAQRKQEHMSKAGFSGNEHTPPCRET